jgi:drug/metabolite transporter (DMT)-like permease
MHALTKGWPVANSIPAPKIKIVAAYLICALTWGTTWFAIRVCIAPGGYPTYQAAALRFTIAVLVIVLPGLVGIVSLKRQQERHLWWLGAAGLFNAAGYTLVFTGEQSVPGSVAAVLFASLPLVTAIVAVITRTETISVAQVIGALVSFAGIAIIFWDRLSVSRQQAFGVAMVLGAVVTTAAYTLIFKRKAQDAHSMSATAIFLGVTCVGLWCVSFAKGWQPIPSPLPLKPTLALLYMSVFGSVIAFACYIYLLKHVSMMTVATLVMVEPVIALLIDHLWEYQIRLDARSYAGAAITLCGILVSLLLKPRHASSPLSTFWTG